MSNKLTTCLVLLLTTLGLNAQFARVQIIHNSPDPTVDVYAGASLLLNDFAFRTASPYVDVPAGIPIPIGIAPSTSTSAADAIFSQSVTFQSGKTYVVTASGVVFSTTTPFSLIANPDARETATASDKVDVAVLHGSPDAPAVDVAVRLGSTVISNLSYGNYTPYLSLNPGEYFLDVKPAGSSSIVQTFKANLSGLAGQAVYIFASGYLTAGAGAPFGLYAALSNGTVVALPATPVARVQVIHNSPSPTVDIYANGGILLNNFNFRSATSFIYLAAGVDINLAIAADTSTSAASAIANYTVNLENGKTYIVTATGVVGSGSAPFNLNINGGGRETSVLGQGKVDFAVLHGSPDAPGVDVSLYDETQNLISDLTFNEYSGYLSVDPGVYYLDVKLAGTATKVGTFKADLSTLGGKAVYVMASGFATPNTTPGFGLFAVLDNGTVVELPAETPPVATEARLQVIHNSPNPTVDVYVNGNLLLNDFEYRDATPFISVPADVVLNVGIALSNSQSVADTLVNFPVVLAADGTYIVTASGVVGSTTTPFTLNVNAGGREASTNSAKVEVAVLHGSPNAPAVDVDEVFTGNIITNLAYGDFTSYLSLDPGVYDLAIRATGTPAAVATFRADLSPLAGSTAYVVASGLIGSTTTPFGLIAVLADGTVIELPLTPTARVQVIHNSPEPTVDVYTGNSLLLNDFAFRTATPFVNLPAGRNFNIGIAPANSASAADAIATFPATLDATKSYTVIAGGIVGNTQTPFNLYIYDNALESAPVGTVAVGLFHGSPNAPAVDVDERLAGPLAENLAFGDATPYLSLGENEYVVDIKPNGSETIVASYLVNLEGLGGQAMRVIASGLLGGSPAFGLYAVLSNGAVVELPAVSVARVQVIHNSPQPTVDVYLNSTKAIDDFEFRTATPFFYFPAGTEITIGIAPANSQSAADVLAGYPVTLQNGGSYIVAASGLLGNTTTPFTLLVNDVARENTVDPTKLELSLLHGAPDAPTVNIVPFNEEAPLYENLDYGEFTDYLSIDPGVIILDVVAASDPTVVAGTYGGDFTPLAGLSGVVFASGLLNDTPGFGLFLATPEGLVIELPSFARAQVIHNSPSPTVDVYVGEDLALEGFAFREATNIGLLPAGEPLELSVAPENSNSVADAIYSLELPEGLKTGKTYVIVAAGVVGNATTPFQLYVNENGRFRSGVATNTDIALFHGAPDAPEVDITLANGTPIFDNIQFGEFADYISVPASQYVLNVTPANDNNTIVASYLASLGAVTGQAITVFASGYLAPAAGQPGFAPWVALTDGTTFPLPIYVSTNELDSKLSDFVLAPNPATDQLTVSFNLKEAEALRYRVYDVAGRTMQEGDWGTAPSGKFTGNMDVSGFGAGLYMLELISDEGSQVSRFAVQR